jgi:hypothetical protein
MPVCNAVAINVLYIVFLFLLLIYLNRKLGEKKQMDANASINILKKHFGPRRGQFYKVSAIINDKYVHEKSGSSIQYLDPVKSLKQLGVMLHTDKNIFAYIKISLPSSTFYIPCKHPTPLYDLNAFLKLPALEKTGVRMETFLRTNE